MDEHEQHEQHGQHARSFGGVADAYDRGRPSYPRDAVVWLTAEHPLSVLELGAGTGKLTEQLVALGHDVHATEPDAAMLGLLAKNLPDVRTSLAPAEDIPSGDAAYDVVVSGQAFHWFDLEKALPEISRVLRPGGRLSLVWNQRDERIPWVRRLGAIIGTQDQLREPAERLEGSRLFDEVEEAEFKHWQTVDRASIQDLVLSRSNIAVLDDRGRAAKMAELLAFYDDYGRGMDGMQLPYVARCFRSVALDRVTPNLTASGSVLQDPPNDEQPTSDGGSTDLLLIDFK